MSASGHALGVRFRGVGKDYDATPVLDAFDLDVAPGEFVTILGPSGSGKTTVLNLLAGFSPASRGTMYIGTVDVTWQPPERRNLGMVFQNFALFPHLSVRQNVEFPLRMRGVPAGRRRQMAMGALERVHLAGHAERRPHELSGGQKQRVSIARALVFSPPVLLMDESLSALDLKLREQLQHEIRRLHRETGTTVLFVTHDQSEAMALSDRIAVMAAGRLVQVGTPEEIHDRPSNRFIADFIGRSNILDIVGGTIARTGIRMNVPTPADAVAISVRPRSIRLLGPDEEADAAFEAEIVDRIYTGEFQDYLLRLASGADLQMRKPAGDAPLAPGTSHRFGFAGADAVPLTS